MRVCISMYFSLSVCFVCVYICLSIYLFACLVVCLAVSFLCGWVFFFLVCNSFNHINFFVTKITCFVCFFFFI